MARHWFDRNCIAEEQFSGGAYTCFGHWLGLSHKAEFTH